MKSLKFCSFVFIIFYNSLSSISFSQNFWQQLNSPDSVKINCVEVNDSGYIFLGCSNVFEGKGGVYRSVDHALTWERVGLANTYVFSLTIDQDDNLYAGNQYINKSYNNGNTWLKLFPPTPTPNVIALRTGYDSIVLAGSWVDPAIIRSGDFGATWKVVDTCDPFAWQNFRDFAFSYDGVIYAGSSNPENGDYGLYSSVDFGQTWNYFGFNECIQSLAFDNNNRLLVGTLATGLYRYDFQSSQWSLLLPNHTINDIIVSSDNRIFLACDGLPNANGGAMVSNDDGNNFNYINSGLFDEYLTDFTIDEQGYLLACVYSDGHLYRSVDQIITNINKINESLSTSLTNSPNPFKDFTILNFTLNGKINSQVAISVYGSDSKLYHQSAGIINFPLKLNTLNWPSGIYIVVVAYQGRSKTLEIIRE